MLDGVAVRIKTPTIDREVTHLVEGELGFTTQAPGGEVQCTFRLNAGYEAFPDLGPMSRCWISDQRGNTLWGAGYADNPGTQYDGAQGFDLTFRGGTSLAEDNAATLPYLDTNRDSWVKDDAVSQYSNGEVDDVRPSDGSAAVVLNIAPGGVLAAGSRVRVVHQLLFDAPADIVAGRVAYVRACGGDSGSTVAGIITGGGTFDNRTAMTAATLSVDTVGVAGAKRVGLDLTYNGATTNATSPNVWSSFSGLRLLMRRKSVTGADVNPTTAAYVLASDVVADLIGRGMLAVDPATTEIAASTFQIDQLLFESATSATILDDLTQFEPDMFWWIGSSRTDTGHRFRFVPWPTNPRYELWSDDGVVFPGGEADLCDRVTVFYTDEKNRQRSTTVVTTDSVVLAKLDGRKRSAPPVTLPDGMGSAANATKAANAILASANAVAQAGNVTIRRRVRDRITGEWHDPAALRSGELAIVADLGRTQRVTATDVSVDASGQENALTLGTPVRSFVDLVSGKKVHRWALPS